MNPKTRQALQSADWDEIYARLRSFVGMMLQKRRLPSGQTEDDLLQEAVSRLAAGTRQWNPDAVSLTRFLKNVIRSILSDKGWYGTEAFDPLAQVYSDAIPDAPAIDSDLPWRAEDARAKWNVIKKALSDDPELLEYLDAKRAGYEKPADIADATGIPIGRVYEIPGKLAKRRAEFTSRLRAANLPHPS